MAATRDGRPHRWVNSTVPGATVFATATCLDFVHAFRRDAARDLATYTLLKEIVDCRAVLHAYVVMPHHFHLLTTCHESQTASQLVQRIKSKVGLKVMKVLTREELHQFDMQSGLNRRTFWRVGFRATEMATAKVFQQKAMYIHLNPVRASYVEQPSEYRWSSRQFWDQGLYTSDKGLPVAEIVEMYR